MPWGGPRQCLGPPPRSSRHLVNYICFVYICFVFVMHLYPICIQYWKMWPMIVFSARHVSHVPKNRRNDPRAKRFSTNSSKYKKYILMCEKRWYIFDIMKLYHQGYFGSIDWDVLLLKIMFIFFWNPFSKVFIEIYILFEILRFL